ncbi:MAG: hypothetical protein JO047_04885 [Alphaproteobacteria bacterium]|nr:hypothetical protein [Alphaproteobacteria bacterium]
MLLPLLPVLSAPLPYSTQIDRSPLVIESGCDVSGGAIANVLVLSTVAMTCLLEIA